MGFYRDVDQRIWGDRKVRALSDPAKLLWFYLLTGQEALPVPGCVTIGRLGLAERMGWTTEKLDDTFAEIAKQDMARADWDAGFIFLPKGIRHRAPANPNIVKNWLEYLDAITECDLRDEAIGALWLHLQRRGPKFMEPFAERFGKPFLQRFAEQFQERFTKRPEEPFLKPPQEPYAEQEWEREWDRDRDGECEGDAASAPPPPVDEFPEGDAPEPEPADDPVVRFIESWNESTGGELSTRRIPDKRRDAVKQALKRQPSAEFWDEAVAKLLEVRAALTVLGESDGWLDFDWFVKTTKGQVLPNAERLVGGKFDFKIQNAAAIRPAPSPPADRTSRYL